MKGIPFQNVVGSFMYVMVCTKPNIVCLMGIVNQFTLNIRHLHWIVVKWIFYYLNGAMDFGICFRGNMDDAITCQVHFDKNVNCS
jgi:ATP-binding cassette subfamily B (MDR/TAP) protein 1